MTVVVDGDSMLASTTIPNEYLMDSLWFVIDELAPRPNLGNFWFHYSDPDTLGNTIMIEHKRLAHTKEVFWGDNPPVGTAPNSFTVKQTSDLFLLKHYGVLSEMILKVLTVLLSTLIFKEEI